jgi:hypothetical protein
LPNSLPTNWEEEIMTSNQEPTNREEYEQPDEEDPAEIIKDAGYNPLDHLWPCRECVSTPCSWENYEARLHVIKARIVLGFPEYKNNEIRKVIYREAAFVVYGFLGRNKRRELPDCVVQGIHSLCPSTTYMGYRPE